MTTGASAMTAQASACAARRPPSSRVSSPVKNTSTPPASADEAGAAPAIRRHTGHQPGDQRHERRLIGITPGQVLAALDEVQLVPVVAVGPDKAISRPVSTTAMASTGPIARAGSPAGPVRPAGRPARRVSLRSSRPRFSFADGGGPDRQAKGESAIAILARLRAASRTSRSGPVWAFRAVTKTDNSASASSLEAGQDD